MRGVKSDLGCPSEDALAAYIAGSDPQVARHLDTCATCRRVVSALAEVNHDEVPRLQTAMADTQVATPITVRETRGPAMVAPGDRLGRFTVERLLGQGGMGEVWAARDSTLDREVAVKVLRMRPDQLGEAGADRLKAEAQAMARLRHPNVVAVYDLGEAGGQLFCAMELVDGVTLRAWLAEERPWRDTLEVILGMGRGIAAAHAAGLVHRDIKPDNVLVTRDGRPLVTDFGLAKPGEQSDETGAVVGTPAYMPLEQLEGRAVGPASDQFSFCVTAYEALFGTRPFSGGTIEALTAAVARGPKVPERSEGVPGGVTRCLLRGLSREPEERYPTMDALLADLVRAANRPARRRAALLLGGGALAIAATVAIVVSRTRTDPQTSVRSAAASRMSAIWGTTERTQLADHLRSLGPPAAANLGGQLVAQLDTYRDEWLAARVDAWAATRVRGEQRAETMERRIACLERAASAMQATIRVLATATATELEQTRDVVTKLPALAACADTTRLAQEPVLPTTPEGAALDAELSALEALHVIGRNADALAKAELTVAAIEKSGDQSRLPRAVFNLGWLLADLGRYADAETQLRRALELGAAAQDHVLVASVWVRLIGLIGLEQRKPEAALALEPAARAAVLQAGNDPLQQARLANMQGFIKSANNDAAGAYEDFKRARELSVVARGPNHLEVAVADINIASVELRINKVAEAQQRLEGIVTAFGAVEAGRRHPTLAQAHQNLCAVAWRQQDYARSEQHCALAAAIYSDSVGADHPATAKARMYRGRALRKLGRLDEAQTEIEAARASRERTLPPENVERIQTDVYVAQVVAERGQWAEAEAMTRKALAALREHRLPAHMQIFTISELARFVAHRAPAEALDLYEEALTLHVANAQRDTSGDAEVLGELAQAALAAGQPDRALAWFAKLPDIAAKLPDVHKALKAKAVTIR